MVVVLDEEEAPAVADVPEAGRVTIAIGPPAAAEPGMEDAPLTAGEGEPVARESRAGTEVTKKWGVELGSSSHQPARCPTRPRVEGLQEGPTRPAPTFSSMADAAQAARLLSGVQTAESEEETRGLSHSALLDMMANGAIGLCEALAHSSNALAKAMARADKYKKESMTQSQSLAHLHQETTAREESLAGRLRDVEGRAEAESGRASAAEAKLELASERLKAAAAQNEELTRRLQRTEEEARVARDEARAAAERAAAAEKAVVEVGSEKARAVACADEASARAEEAESRAWEAEARAKEAEARAQQAETRA